MSFRATAIALARRAQKMPPNAPKENAEDLRSQFPLLIEAMTPVKPLPPMPEEEHQRLRQLMIRYGKLRRKQFLEMQLRKNAAMRALWVAIDALPHKRRVEAVFTEPPQYPDDLRIPTHTPPIKGFDMSNLTKQSSK